MQKKSDKLLNNTKTPNFSIQKVFPSSSKLNDSRSFITSSSESDQEDMNTLKRKFSNELEDSDSDESELKKKRIKKTTSEVSFIGEGKGHKTLNEFLSDQNYTIDLETEQKNDKKQKKVSQNNRVIHKKKA